MSLPDDDAERRGRHSHAERGNETRSVEANPDDDAERRGRHSHAERGNEKSPRFSFPRGAKECLPRRSASIKQPTQKKMDYKQQAQHLENQNKALRTTLEVKEKELQEKNQQLQELQTHLEQLKSSESWKIKESLRKSRLLLKKARHFYRNRLHNIIMTAPESRSTETQPQIILSSSKKRLPTGWCIITGRLEAETGLSPDLLIFNDSPVEKRRLSVKQILEIEELIRLPDTVHALRLDPLNREGTFPIDKFKIREIGTSQAVIKLLWPKIRFIISHPTAIATIFAAKWHIYKTNGWSGLIAALLHQSNDTLNYQQWIQSYSTLTKEDRNLISRRNLTYQPLISILMPVYNTPEELLRLAIESVIAQLYPNWQLCIADDASTQPHIRTILEKYQKKDQRIKIVYREKNGHISAATNSALALATGEFIAMLDHDDELAPHALYMVAEELNNYPKADIIYSDEDKIDEKGKRFYPHFKSDWNPDLFYTNNYICHLFICRTTLLRSTGGLREGVEGSQDYDLILRCLTKTKPERIRHIPHILYHWRAISGSTALYSQEKDYATKAGAKALTDYFSTTNPAVKIEAGPLPTTYKISYPIPNPEPKVSLIIPTRNSYKILRICVESILKKTTYKNYEIIVVNNQSDEKESLDYLNEINHQERIQILNYDKPFNYSALNNFAVNHTEGELIGLINNDIEVISPEWLEEMIQHAIKPEIGAVGAKLLYPNNTIQHAGVILGVGGVAEHSHKGFFSTHHGYCARLSLVQTLSSVTAACLLVKRKLYEEVNGLEEEKLPIAFNDVDFCLRLQDAGYRNVWTPYAELYHHESISRGNDDSPEKHARFRTEVEYMLSRWGARLGNDPYYNPNLNLKKGDFTLAWPPRINKPWL